MNGSTLEKKATLEQNKSDTKTVYRTNFSEHFVTVITHDFEAVAICSHFALNIGLYKPFTVVGLCENFSQMVFFFVFSFSFFLCNVSAFFSKNFTRFYLIIFKIEFNFKYLQCERFDEFCFFSLNFASMDNTSFEKCN